TARCEWHLSVTQNARETRRLEPVAETRIATRSSRVAPRRRLRNRGVESAQPEAIQHEHARANANPNAELSAHLEAATARLLDLIRQFDARGGWGNGFRSC